MALRYETAEKMLLDSGFKVINEALCTSGCELVVFEKENTEIECYHNGIFDQNLLLECAICDKKSLTKTRVAATFGSRQCRFVKVCKERFMDIVCNHTGKEWMKLFNEYDVNKSLEVLSGT